MKKLILTAALVFSACATTGSTGSGNGSGTGNRQQVKSQNANTGNGGGEQTASVPKISSKAQLIFDDALKAYEQQKKVGGAIDYPGLEKRFRAAADADPQLAEAIYNLGVLADRQGKTKEAVSLYKEALAKKPTLRQAAENIGVIAQNNGDEQGATRIYTDILNAYPDDASSRARLAELARRRGELDRAIELSREALFRDPKTLQAYKTMMQVYYEQKQFSMARLIALRASKLTDTDPDIPYTLGLMNMAEKDPVKARANFKRAVEVQPKYLSAHYQLCQMAFEKEDYQGAEEHLRAILQANGKNPEALLNLGVAYKGMGQLDKAMATYDEVAKLNSEMPELYLNRGIIIGLKGDPEKAITMFKTYIARKAEGGLGVDHPVHKLIEEQEKAIAKREEDKRIAEEAAKMEEEMKKQMAAQEEEERKKKEEEFQKQKADAKAPPGKAGSGDKVEPGKGAPPPVEKKEEPKPEAKKAPPPAPAPAAAPPPAAAPAKKSGGGDEPDDGL